MGVGQQKKFTMTLADHLKHEVPQRQFKILLKLRKRFLRDQSFQVYMAIQYPYDQLTRLFSATFLFKSNIDICYMNLSIKFKRNLYFH